MLFYQIKKKTAGVETNKALITYNTSLNTGGKGSKTSFWDFARMGGWVVGDELLFDQKSR